MMSAHKELDQFLDKKATLFTDGLLNLVMAYWGTGKSIPEARKEFAELISNTMVLADLNGRKRLYMEYDHAKNKASRFADLPDSTPLAPTLTFDEAVDDLLKREPRLAQSAAEVSRLYSTEKVFAMARAAELHITQRAQEAIGEFLKSNGPTEALSKTIQEIGPFSQAYADTVFRTNVANAYNQGRITQADDPELADIIVGFRYDGVDDWRTRDNHRAGFGTIAPTDDPLWNTFRPPNGYNCRCSLEFVSRFEAERLGLWKDDKLVPRYTSSHLHPDPGFKSGGLF